MAQFSAAEIEAANEAWAEVRALLEPAARSVAEKTGFSVAELAAASLAISLKRLADAVEEGNRLAQLPLEAFAPAARPNGDPV